MKPINPTNLFLTIEKIQKAIDSREIKNKRDNVALRVKIVLGNIYKIICRK